jgi:hypothetical protein
MVFDKTLAGTWHTAAVGRVVVVAPDDADQGRKGHIRDSDAFLMKDHPIAALYLVQFDDDSEGEPRAWFFCFDLAPA